MAQKSELYARARRESRERVRRHEAIQAGLLWASVLFVVACLVCAYWLGLSIKHSIGG